MLEFVHEPLRFVRFVVEICKNIWFFLFYFIFLIITHIWICRRDFDEVEEKTLIYRGERESGKTKVKREEEKER